MSRTDRLRDLLDRTGLDGAVVARPPHVFYLTGARPRLREQSFAVLGPSGVALVAAGSAERLAAEIQSGVAAVPYLAYDSRTVPDEVRNAAAALLTAVERVGLAGRRIGIEAAFVGAGYADALRQVATVSPLADQLALVRRRKDPDEVAQIRHAVGLNDRGFAAAQRAIARGVTELEVYAAIHREISLAAGQPVSLEGDFVSGPRTLGIGGPPTNRALEAGDLFIIDLFPFIGGYKGDTTRNFVVGRPSAQHASLHEALEAAQRRGAEELRPGVRACDVYAAVRGSLAEAKLADFFPHHAGHAIGLFHPERPYLVPGDDLPLEEDMVVTLEPGAYVPGVGGMRLEQNYRITADGAEPLSRFPLPLVVCL